MKWIGGGLVFLAELGMYFALGWLPVARFGGLIGWLVGVAVVVLVAAVWARFLAPKASHPLPMQPALIVRTLLLASGAAAFLAVGAPVVAIAQIAAIVIGTPLMMVWPPEPPRARAA